MIRIREDGESVRIIDAPLLWLAVGFGTAAAVGWAVLREQSLPAAERQDWLSWPGVGVAVFIAGMLWFGTISIFRFDLARREIRWKRIGILGLRSGCLSFDDVARVSVARCYGVRDDGGRQSYRVTLETDAGEIPIQHSFTRGEAAMRQCTAIADKIESILRPMRTDRAAGPDRCRVT